MSAVKDQPIIDAFLGLATGDALGVPVEFTSRESLVQNPVTGLRSYGTHRQPAGTWSDDASLTFCLGESLCTGYDLTDMGNRFVNWKERSYWSARGEVFDIGIGTSEALHRISRGTAPVLAGGADEGSNGNGSLMRILPLLFSIEHLPMTVRFQKVQEVSSITHRHIRSVLGCFIYLEFARLLLIGMEPKAAFIEMQRTVKVFLHKEPICSTAEYEVYNRIWDEDNPLFTLPESAVCSSGYVVHTLEASLWCLLTTASYKEAVLKAVNLGQDTDTTGAVTGGLAGLVYGVDAIPADWLQVLAKKDDITALAMRFSKSLSQ